MNTKLYDMNKNYIWYDCDDGCSLTLLLKKSSITSSILENISPNSAKGLGIENCFSSLACKADEDFFCDRIGAKAHIDGTDDTTSVTIVGMNARMVV